jgi:hypothetical protein
MKKILILGIIMLSLSRLVTLADGIVFGIDPSFIFKDKTDQSNMMYNIEYYDQYYDQYYDGERILIGSGYRTLSHPVINNSSFTAWDFTKFMTDQMDDSGDNLGGFGGYRFENIFNSTFDFMPYLSFKHSEFTNTFNYDRIDDQSGILVKNEYSQEVDRNLYTIGIGFKFWFLSSEDIKAFTNFQYLKPIFTGNFSEKNPSRDQFELSRLLEFQNKTFESVSMSSYEFSVGAEYFITKRFSLGAEYGLRFNNVDWTIYGSSTTNNGIEYDTETQLSVSAKPTFARLTLNFYF